MNNYKKLILEFRICPKEIEDLLPPHPIEFHKDDNDFGRSCGRCGFAVPSGCRHIHADWCEKRFSRNSTKTK